MYVYLSISNTTVNSALIRCNNSIKLPIYYVSKSFVDSETRYPLIEKLALALVVSARRLRPYFQAHTIHVLTDQSLKQVLQKPETSGRLVKWAIELGEFDIHYKPHNSIKGQAAANFISELIPISSTTILESPTNLVRSSSTLPLWKLYVDGFPNNKCSGAGIIITSSDESVYEYSLKFNFHTTNNMAEYETLIAGPQLVRELGAE